MLFLGIDTATRVGSVGLVRAAIEDGDVVASEPGRIADGCETLAEVSRDTGLGHGIELLPLIDECLACANVSLEDVACIAVSIGPGSFTGLRVALATAKGLALGGTATLVGVPTLEAYAASVLPGWGADEDALAAGTLVAACLDARKGEVYAATFAVREPVWHEPSPRLERLSPDLALAPERFAAELAARSSDAPAILLGDGPARYANAIAHALAGRVDARSFSRSHPRGATVARLGAGMFAAAGPSDRATLVPQYARASEAEIMRAQRGAASGTQPR